ncbi:NAD(P)H-hydrate dehydratase [Algoriphagus litoralis]|uniref:NAD(P)H-hydrate dehydratase n=1 Tax=Algoriphagus litoralis TaxID=2202829 RepID=UPI000DBA7C95|nr:NAD(P)H-hydrate dehydratase [Algoriphagus litoralis]
MLKILNGNQVKLLDLHHIQMTGISSLELMEQAALGFVRWWKDQGFPQDLPVAIFCGAGNNGGDGFAIARLLYELRLNITVYTCFDERNNLSADASRNFQKLPEKVNVRDWKDFNTNGKALIIDAFLGVGLKGDLRGQAKEILAKINSSSGIRVSVDIPSGLPSDTILGEGCVKADYTVTFAFPKLSLLFPEHASVTGELAVVDIGIKDEAYEGFQTSTFFLRKKDVSLHHRKFHRFSHKGDFGKVLLVSGSKGKMGASLLACKAALRTGSGLVSALVQESERQIIQSSVPEVMCLFDLPQDLSTFDSVGLGPGIGIEGNAFLVERVFQLFKKPMVIDADGLTILSQNPDLMPLIPEGSILTPHLKEFDRLLGQSTDHPQRLKKAKEFCQKWKLNLIIKGANSVICLADGRQIFNSSGTQYMATGGSGDVLTGMITSFLGQGYSPENAMICGVYHHGLAGEIAGGKKRRGTIASDIIEAIPATFIELDIS